MSYELVGPASPMARLVHWLDHWRGRPRSAAARASSPSVSESFDATAFANLSVDIEAEIETMSSARAAQSLTQSLKGSVDRLPAQQRQMLLLHVNGGLAYWQIARRLGVDEGAVLTELSRAYSQLCVELGSDELRR